MSQTLKAGLVRFHRPILIGGSAILGVATSNLLSNVTTRSALLAVAALCLMYVGDVGRAASERVARLLPPEAVKDLVKSTQAHNLGSKRRSAGILAVAAVGMICLAGSLLASIAHDSGEPSAEHPPLSIQAPTRYAVGSDSLIVRVGCPTTCNAALLYGEDSLMTLSVPEGAAAIQLPTTLLSFLLSQRGLQPWLKMRLSSGNLAPIEAHIRLSGHPQTRGG